MSKVMTSVLSLFFILMFANQAIAQTGVAVNCGDEPTPNDYGIPSAEQALEAAIRSKDKDDIKRAESRLKTANDRLDAAVTRYTKKCEDLVKSQSASEQIKVDDKKNDRNQTQCNETQKQFTEMAKDLNNKCENQMAMAGALKSCYDAINDCLDSNKEDYEAGIGSDGNLYFNVEEGCEFLQKCPARAAGRIKNWQASAEKFEKQREDLADSRLKAEQEQAELVAKMARDLQQKQKEIQDISNAENEILSRLPEQIAGLDLQSRNELNQLRETIQKLDFETDRAEQAQNQAISDYQNQISSIEAKCKTDARAKYDAAAAASSSNVGGIGRLLTDSTRNNRLLSRVENYECTQASVVNARAIAQREFNRKLSDAQTAYSRFKDMATVQRRSIEDIFRKFDQQKKIFADRNKTELTKLSSRKTQIMTELATLSQEMQSKQAIAQQRSTNAEQRSQRLEQTIALNNSNLSCSGGITPNEKANPKVATGFENNFLATAQALCKANAQCKDFGGVISPFDKSFNEKLRSTAECDELKISGQTPDQQKDGKPKDPKDGDRNTASTAK